MWSDIMAAINKALGEDTGVRCMEAFYKDNEDIVGNQLIDVGLHHIKGHVNKYYGN